MFPECDFGGLRPIYLPPHAVSIPRTEVSMEGKYDMARNAFQVKKLSFVSQLTTLAIIGMQPKSKQTPIQRDFSCRKYLF